MVWAGIRWRGKTTLVCLTNKISTVEYVRMLQDVYEPLIGGHYSRGAILQQNMALEHPATYTADNFMESGIIDLPWVPRLHERHLELLTRPIGGARLWSTI